MPDKDIAAEFPVAGVSAAAGFGVQPPRTAADARNVRATDALATRQRGGSRPGLSKYVTLPVDGTAGHPVQHMNAIVDPTVAALLASFEAWDPPGAGGPTEGVADPSDGTRNPGRLIRPGGSGVQPNRNVPQRRQAQHRQSKGHAFAFAFGTAGTTRADALAFDQPVRRKSLVVVAFEAVNPANISAQTQHAVTDSIGLQWHESPGSWEGPFPAGSGYDGAARLFWAYADFPEDAKPLTVTVTTTAVPDPMQSPAAPSCGPLALGILEYTGVKFAAGGSTAALDDSAAFTTGLTTATNVIPFALGTALAPTSNYGLLLGVFAGGVGLNGAAPVAATPAANPAFAVRLNVSSDSLVVVEATGGLAATPATPGITVDYTGLGTLTAFHWAFLGASFQRDA